VYHVPGMENLLSVSQLTANGNYAVFKPKDVKVYYNLKPTGESVMEGKKNRIYVLSAKSTYVVKARRTRLLWHARLGHVSYHKLKSMMEKSMLKGHSLLEIRRDTVCVGCQYDNYHTRSRSFEQRSL